MNIKTKTCSKCGETKTLDEFSGRHGKCKSCRNALSRQHYKNNPEKRKEQQKEYYKNNAEKRNEYSKEWQKNNPDKVAARDKRYKKNNPDKIAARLRKYQKNNPGKVNAIAAKRRASKLQQTPLWSETKEIEALYTEARRLTKETGVKHEVDHALPLQGEHVSGLHVYDNLQILTAHENHTKSNKFAVG